MVLHDISFDINKGDVIAILGHNGAGKTTLVKHTLGLLKPTNGRVLLEGKDTRKMSVAQAAQTVGYVFQSPTQMLFAPTVEEELAFGPRNLRYDPGVISENVDWAIKTVHMAKKSNLAPAARGEIVTLEHTSKVLANNPLGDPHVRPLNVYLPAVYQTQRARNRRFPVLFDLVGFTGSGPSHLNWKNFDENVPEQLDRLISTGKLPPLIVVFPDCFTSLGGHSGRRRANGSASSRVSSRLRRG